MRNLFMTELKTIAEKIATEGIDLTNHDMHDLIQELKHVNKLAMLANLNEDTELTHKLLGAQLDIILRLELDYDLEQNKKLLGIE